MPSTASWSGCSPVSVNVPAWSLARDAGQARSLIVGRIAVLGQLEVSSQRTGARATRWRISSTRNCGGHSAASRRVTVRSSAIVDVQW